jgi:hypothetical protein
MDNACIFSPDRKYRYTLVHVWDQQKEMIAFIGLNPSTADENQLDPTLRRIKGYATDWGYGSFAMLNLFAYRSTDPSILYEIQDPIGPENDRYITAVSHKTNLVIACWGNHGELHNRGEDICRILKPSISLKCLQLTKSNQPSHPLYLKKELRPRDF